MSIRMELSLMPKGRSSGGRTRRKDVSAHRVRRDGKFLRLGADKFYVKGVTYGPFAANSQGEPLPEPQQARRDFAQMRELGANCLRLYHPPPHWFMDAAEECGLKIFLDVAWPKNLTFLGDAILMSDARRAVRRAAGACGNHASMMALSVVNEIPPDVARYLGAAKVEKFIDELVEVAKNEAPECLVTFANFPTTEYLQPNDIDFLCYNVYLHDEKIFRNYLGRLQNIAGEKPLMLGEYGVDTARERTLEGQAEILGGHLRGVFEEGLIGAFLFSYTDEWFTHGTAINEWQFGLVRADRTPKPSFKAVQEVFRRAPQTADDRLPRASVVVCSYNGASTVESCLLSLEKLHYADYEVIFVDDGSTDQTQEIVKKFPRVRNIQQENKGLSYARNVGLAAATGDVVVYTDSDCEADEDWLYYLCLALVRSGHAGIGGPNLIPDEESWVADCVGLAPGGPTHVMIDDRTAEHVPGCNMGFYRWALNDVHGFDPQFRKAGDDVDAIWRVQHRGNTIGFSPAAQVWHYRRNTVKAYLNQQRGYGQAEAMLKYKHPDQFNVLGASHWRGRIYGGVANGVRLGRDVIYHGVFGTGLFQTMYRRPASLAAMMLMSMEWQALACFVAILGLALLPAFTPLLWAAVAMLAVPIVLAIVAAVQAPRPRHWHLLSRPLIAYLHWRQPLTRGWARYSNRVRMRAMRQLATTSRARQALPFDPEDSSVLRYWSSNLDRLALVDQLRQEIAHAAWRFRADSGWHDWDMEVYTNRYVFIRVYTVSEEHHGKGLLTKVRVSLGMSNFCKLMMAASIVLAVQLLDHVWPFSRPAVLIPLIWFGIYIVNRRHAAGPVMNLIDAAARRAGFDPIPTHPVPVAEPAAAAAAASAPSV
ncbi:MAG TPA: glycosyltransferase, partial [Tepidisphaeraceae bacterium]|nr:glycosyltransferase [Tepidisphaeraceae bacterium]